MCGVFAEFERSIIQERVKAGLARARKKGVKLGRPRISATMEGKVLDARQGDRGMNNIARKLGIGVSTVQRVVATS